MKYADSTEFKIDLFVNKFREKFYEHKAAFDINIARIVILGAIIYKLLSRDFSFFAHVPEEVFSYYPIFIYSPGNFILTTGIPGIFELATFHWIHWLLPFPNEIGFHVIQALTVMACTLTLFFGRGPGRIFVISSYIGIMYLWGFIHRSGMDIDAMFLSMGCLLVYMLSRHKDVPLYNIHKTIKDTEDRQSGWTYSGFLAVFIIYYFAAGVNKIPDITLAGWFQYDLVGMYQYSRDKAAAGFVQHVPGFYKFLDGKEFLNYIGPPAVYLCHLTAPIMFFYRSHLAKFFIFYGTFHFLAISVSIIFFANFLLWTVFIPYKRIICFFSSNRKRKSKKQATAA